MTGFSEMDGEEDLKSGGGSLWAADDADAVVRRFRYALAAVGLATTVVAGACFGLRDAAGVALGVALAAVNFHFMQTAIRSILGAGHERAPSGTTLMFLTRWFLVGALAFAAYRLGWASGGGILAGLLSTAGAALLEAVFQVWATFTRRDGSNGNQSK